MVSYFLGGAVLSALASTLYAERRLDRGVRARRGTAVLALLPVIAVAMRAGARTARRRRRLADAPRRRRLIRGRGGVVGIGDDPRALGAAAAQEADRPAEHHDESVLVADQVPDVDAEPDQPGREPAQANEAQIGDGAAPADRGQVALVDDTETA